MVNPLRLFASAGLLILAFAVSAQTVFTNQHVDLNARYVPGQPWAWALNVRNSDGGGTEYGPGTGNGEALLFVGSDARVIRNPNPSFDFIGVGPNETYWRLPQNQNPLILYLGVAAYGVSASTIDSYDPAVESQGRVSGTAAWVKIRLLRVIGPGHVSIWQSGVSGPIVFCASSDGIDANDALWVVAGGHLHFNYGFTAPGLYDVAFQVSVHEPDGNPSTVGPLRTSCPKVVHFGVEATTGPKLSGTVDLQDWIPSPVCEDIVIELRPVAGGPIVQRAVINTLTDETFEFPLLPSVSPGEYHVTAKAAHWLRQRRSSVVIGATGASGLAFSLVNGDVDGDNEISIGDYSLLSLAFGTEPGAPAWDTDSDLNGDESVDIGDYAILSSNFNQIGDD